MGIVFGKQTVKEPPFTIVLERNKDAKTSYTIRKYGERYAASVTYISTGSKDDTSTPFRTLARYIGVFGTPENEGKHNIDMTAPVVMEKEQPESIAMTAPVVMEKGDDGKKKMMFMLPEEYNDLSKIPKPTNPDVHIEIIPSEVGAVHQYNGNYDENLNRGKAKELYSQLVSDGVEGITEEFVLDNYQFWGYNPPFTIPYFKRNEVWLKLNEGQVRHLTEKFPAVDVSGSSNGMKGKTMLGIGICSFLVGACAIGIFMKSKSKGGTRYSRIDG